MSRSLFINSDQSASSGESPVRPVQPGQFRSGDDLRIERHEAKYIVPFPIIQEIRRYIQPYVVRDKHGIGGIPKYLVRTIQLDSRSLCLHYAKEVEQLNRFKLRIRTYGTDGNAPYFVEIKRKLGAVIVKSRSVLMPDQYSPELFLKPGAHVRFPSDKQHMNYLDFLRLSQEIGAQPVTMIQYERESYMGRFEDYARVTFDTKVCYQMTPSYDFGYVKNGRWRRIDTATGLRTDYAGFVMELKSKMGIPRWMLDFVRAFNLVRVGFCKYSAALRLESLSAGHQYSEGSENCVPESKW
jgi:hypothetical protein